MGKRILIISRYYPPEISAAGVCVSAMATRLVRSGHEVTVLTTVPNYPTGIIPPAYRRAGWLQQEVIDGVKVVRVWCYISANQGFLRRIIAQLSFGFTAPLLGWRSVGRPDVIITGSPPLFNALAGRLLALANGCPHIFWVADLWPESAIQLGMLRNRLLIWLSERLEWSTYRHALLVWVVSPDQQAILIRRGLDPAKIFLLTNGVDCERFSPMPRSEARAYLGWGEHFTVVYAGGHGAYHGLTTILDAAELLLKEEDVRFVLIGEGAEKAALIQQARQRKLKNILFLEAQPHEQMPYFLNAANAALVPVRDIPLFRGMLPMKMYEGMACGCPLILAVNGVAQEWGEQAGAVLHISPEAPAELAEAILYLRDHPTLAEQMGRNGRQYVLERFDYQRLAQRLHRRLEHLDENWQAEDQDGVAVSAEMEEKGGSFAEQRR